MIIRQAQVGDEARLAELNVFVQALHVSERPDYFKPADREEVAAWFRSLFDKPKARLWAAEEAGALLGYALVLRKERAENPFCWQRQWHELDQISVEPSSRRKGVARALIEKVCAEAAAEGVSDVEVSSWAFNSVAHEAFERCGFKPRMLRFEATRTAASPPVQPKREPSGGDTT